MIGRFCRFQLRTTDVDAARRFYAPLIGAGEIAPLPEAALARGARPHWLGSIGVEDVEIAAAAFTARGAVRLGGAIFRDPGGAIVGLTGPAAAPSRDDVVWHELNATDATRATEAYVALFGWRLGDRLDLAPLGQLQLFSFQDGGPPVGSIADITGRPGRHAHWLFHFRTPAVDAAVAAVRAAGGLALDPITLPDGDRVAVCDDPQGAAFALRSAG